MINRSAAARWPDLGYAHRRPRWKNPRRGPAPFVRNTVSIADRWDWPSAAQAALVSPGARGASPPGPPRFHDRGNPTLPLLVRTREKASTARDTDAPKGASREPPYALSQRPMGRQDSV